MGMVDVHGALERTRTLVGMIRVSKWGWAMAMGPLKRKQTLVWRVRTSRWGGSMAWGP